MAILPIAGDGSRAPEKRSAALLHGRILGPRQTLHLKTIRAAGEITFKGYGRAAAAMTPLDVSRLLIATAGSTFAKDSADVRKRFAKLKPLRTRSAGDTLEQFLAVRIAELPMEFLRQTM